MANAPANAPAKPAKRGKLGLLIWAVVAPLVIGAGAAVPWMMGMLGGGSSAEAADAGDAHGAASSHGAPAAHGAAGPGGGHGAPAAHGASGHGVTRTKSSGKNRPVAVPFGDTLVNLGDARMTRYLRVKMLLAVDESKASEVEELLTRQKAFLKSWLIGYLSDQTMKDVERSGVNRIRREVRDQFNVMLYPDGEERILDILFDEYVVQ